VKRGEPDDGIDDDREKGKQKRYENFGKRAEPEPNNKKRRQCDFWYQLEKDKDWIEGSLEEPRKRDGQRHVDPDDDRKKESDNDLAGGCALRLWLLSAIG
jgi:hypothetical protein